MSKKKGKGKGKQPEKKKDAQPDESTSRLYFLLRKSLEKLGLSLPKRIEERFAEINVEKTAENLFDLIIWEPIGMLGVR
jgi:hypothetical protein